jgi:hypothetical protein
MLGLDRPVLARLAQFRYGYYMLVWVRSVSDKLGHVRSR